MTNIVADTDLRAWLPRRQLNIEDAVTNTVTTLLTLDHSSTGTVAANFGLRLLARLEDASGNVVENAGALDFIWADATGASEDCDLVISLKTAGAALAERHRFSSTGVYTPTGGVNLNNTDLTGVKDIYGSALANHNIYSNAALTDANERSLILNVLNATGDAWLPMITLTPGAAAPTMDFNLRPIVGLANTATKVAAQTELQGDLAVRGSLSTLVLATPGAPTITNVGTGGATTYTYKVTATVNSRETDASAGGSTATGNAVLDANNYNTVTWTQITGATGYKIYRTVGGATQGLISTIASGATVTVNDTGLAGGGETAPTVNHTGQVAYKNGNIPYESTHVQRTLAIYPSDYSVINAGTFVTGADNATYNYFFMENSSAADLDSISYYVYLAAGTYTLRVITFNSSNRAILDVDIDTTEVASFDMYNAAQTRNVVNTQTAIVLAASGVKNLKLRCDGKNGASSGYVQSIQQIIIIRTA